MKLKKECKIEELTIYHSNIKNGNSAQFNCFINLKNDKEENILTKIYDSSKIKLTLEAKDPILDDIERKYLSGVIRPFRDKVCYIEKYEDSRKESEWIEINLALPDSNISLPFFKKNTMYKNLELGKEYKLEDLEL